MWRRLAAGLLVCASGLAHAGDAIPRTAAAELEAFLRDVVAGAPRTPHHFSLELEPLGSGDGRNRVLPTVAIVAGRLGSERCLYQFRLETWPLSASGSTAAPQSESSGGRSTVKQAPCDTLVSEVMAITEYEVGALRNRIAHGAPRANNLERDALIAAVRDLPPVPELAENAETYSAQTGSGRVNVRTAPSLAGRVRAQLAPRTALTLLATAQPDWFRTQDGRGFVHRSGLQALTPAAAVALTSPASLRVTTGSAYVSVREAPSFSGRVVNRLRPNSPLSLQAVPEANGWYRIEDGSGYVPAAALTLPPEAVALAAGNQRAIP